MRGGSVSAAVFRLTLSAPASTAASASASVRMPPPTASGMNNSRATARMVSASARRLSSVAVMSRITGASQPFEVDALDDLTVAHVEAGNDAFRQHRSHCLSQPVAQDLQADFAGFLRVKLHTRDLAALDDRRERLAVF